MRSMLERYVSRNVVREVLDNRDDFLTKLGGTRQPVTVLFSDVRGFTSFSEHADATAVVDQLNDYLGEMVGIVFRNHGTVDKFIGDGIMAVWGNVVSEGEGKDALRAVSAAVEMLARLASLNEEWSKKDIRPFHVGIGIHHGDAVFGNIGSSEKMEPTVIGDTVNLASRVEGLTKKYGLSLCVTRPVADHAREYFRFRSVDLVRAVGKSRPVEILTVVGRRDEESGEWLDRYESAVTAFRAQRFTEAATTLRQCLEEEPTDRLCAMYLQRAESFIAAPPPADWDGAEIATSK
jgi:adenylate cyclase